MIAEVDLLDLAPFAAGQEHRLFRQLRDRDTIAFSPEADGPGFYSLTRYDHVMAGARDHARLISGKGTQIADRRAEGHGHASVHNSDGALHSRLRSIVLDALSRRSIMARHDRIRAIAGDLVDAIVPGETFDLVEQVAVRLPMLVIADVLGVPPHDAERLVDWANLMSDVRATNAEQADARATLYAYFRDLADQRRQHPAQDVATALVSAGLEQSALDAYFMLLTVAGNETTRFLLTGGLAQLSRQPQDFARIRNDRSLMARLIDEMARFVSPVTHMRRTTSEAMDLFGTQVPAGAKVVLWFASANHDERQFASPDRLVVDRRPNQHVGFGAGAHFCVGAHLARLETELFLNAFLDRFAMMELMAEPVRLPSNWFTGWTEMQVRC